MALSDSFTIEINKVNQSRLPETDIQNPVFGTVFSDHMLICEYKNGQWSNPKIQPYGNLSISPGARVFHYGQAIFEGMKAYRDAQGQVWLFRPEENFPKKYF
jgi:branched-chain amino acid aminotransferase